MRKIFFILIAVIMTATVYGGTPEVYIPAEQLPRLMYIMPAPPAFDSPEFASDEVRYNWGKVQRQDSVRLAIAIADAEWNDLEQVLNRWQEAFGMPISEASTPHIYALLVNSITTVDPMRIEPKAFIIVSVPLSVMATQCPRTRSHFFGEKEVIQADIVSVDGLSDWCWRK